MSQQFLIGEVVGRTQGVWKRYCVLIMVVFWSCPLHISVKITADKYFLNGTHKGFSMFSKGQHVIMLIHVCGII